MTFTRSQLVTVLNHHTRQKLSLRIQNARVLEDPEFEVMPLVRRPRLACGVAEDPAIIHAQKICDAVAILVLRLLQVRLVLDQVNEFAEQLVWRDSLRKRRRQNGQV